MAQAWLGANLAMATAMGVLNRGIGKVGSSHAACRLLEGALQECHRQLMKVLSAANDLLRPLPVTRGL